MNNNFLTVQLLECVFSKNEFKSFDEILDYLLERRFDDFQKEIMVIHLTFFHRMKKEDVLNLPTLCRYLIKCFIKSKSKN